MFVSLISVSISSCLTCRCLSRVGVMIVGLMEKLDGRGRYGLRYGFKCLDLDPELWRRWDIH